jgi:hypothetical protein
MYEHSSSLREPRYTPLLFSRCQGREVNPDRCATLANLLAQKFRQATTKLNGNKEAPAQIAKTQLHAGVKEVRIAGFPSFLHIEC